MKKFLTSALFIVVFSAYALHQYFGGKTGISTASATPVMSVQTAPVQSSNLALNTTATEPTPTPAPKTTPASLPTPVPAPKPRGQYVDGTYTGNVADAYYGNVQVRVDISGGKITAVAFLQYPNDRDTSRYINAQAMPMLTQEALQAQSANIDGVSGATATSDAFVESLSSALTQARA
jgi:uncharacterized protein with FMN-binding domain